jgi:hypothetical protein
MRWFLDWFGFALLTVVDLVVLECLVLALYAVMLYVSLFSLTTNTASYSRVNQLKSYVYHPLS